MYLNLFLDKAKIILDAKSETMLGKKLGLTPSELHRARRASLVRDDALRRLARILGTPFALVMAAKQADSTRDPLDKIGFGKMMKSTIEKEGIATVTADDIQSINAAVVETLTDADLEAISEEMSEDYGMPFTVTKKNGDLDIRFVSPPGFEERMEQLRAMRKVETIDTRKALPAIAAIGLAMFYMMGIDDGAMLTSLALLPLPIKITGNIRLKEALFWFWFCWLRLGRLSARLPL